MKTIIQILTEAKTKLSKEDLEVLTEMSIYNSPQTFYDYALRKSLITKEEYDEAKAYYKEVGLWEYVGD